VLNGKAEPVSIGALERFVNEYAIAHGLLHAVPPSPNGFRTAVLGSGPGGLACADELSKLGYTVTVFEARALPGGLLVNGIPAFKLEKTVVGRRIELLKKRGVKFCLGVHVGRDITLQELLAEFDAIFLGFGALQAKGLDNLPGADLKGIYQALPFIVQKNVPGAIDLSPIEVEGRRVVVLGGGDTAMDCLRTAIRCGAAEVTCMYRRDFANMPGSRKEYQSALEEGANFSFLTNPVRLLGDGQGQVTHVRAIRMQLGDPDASGRRKPIPVPQSEFDQPADVIFIAYGFDPVPFPTDSDLADIHTDAYGRVTVDDNQMTNIPAVFAGGDLVRGPSLVVHAVRDGRKAAKAIDSYLKGHKPKRPVCVEPLPSPA
jgi:glutamate synthase (NADPH/NADH) small chain